MIRLSHLSFAYPASPPIFADFSLEIPPGQAWSVIGPSGCGKTTLLYLLAGLRFPTSGSISIQGQLLRHVRPQTGLILQDYGLLPWATVRQNAALGVDVRQFYGPDGRHAPSQAVAASLAEVDAWLERLGLAEVRSKYPAQCSGGQRQRVAIARTLVLKPDLLLMDEPFSSLDAPSRESLQDLTLELCREQCLTLVAVTHAIEEAVLLGQRILVLSEPPNCNPLVIDNPHQASKEYRHGPEFNMLCQQVRQSLSFTLPPA